MIKLSELKDEIVLMDENSRCYTVKEAKNDLSINGNFYVTTEYQASVDARDVLETAIENEYGNMYEDWNELVLDDITDEDVERIQAVLDDIFNRNKEQNTAYYQDEKVDMDN